MTGSGRFPTVATDPPVRLVTYNFVPSRDTTNPCAPCPVLMNVVSTIFSGSITETPFRNSLATKNAFPSGEILTSAGLPPT